MPIATGNLFDGVHALVDGKFVTLRIPYPLGFYTKGFEGRIDDANAGWKGRGLWVPSGDRTPWLKEGGKGTKPLVVHFQMRPNPLESDGAAPPTSAAAVLCLARRHGHALQGLGDRQSAPLAEVRRCPFAGRCARDGRSTWCAPDPSCRGALVWMPGKRLRKSLGQWARDEVRPRHHPRRAFSSVKSSSIHSVVNTTYGSPGSRGRQSECRPC